MYIGPHTCMSGYVSAYHGVGKLCILLHTILCHAVMTAAMQSICIKAVTTKRLNSTAGNIKDSAFIYAGFCNWKDATVAFPNHEKSDTHKTAVELVVTLPETTKDVGELLSSTHAAVKSENKKCVITIATVFGKARYSSAWG